MSENQIAVETQGLTKIYGSGNTQVIAMEDVTLRVKHGEVVALLGPSGAGKSTLLTSVGLINLPTSGKVMINGTPVIDGARSLTDLTRFRRNHIGYVFQKSNLIPFLSALENVQIALELNGWLAPKAKKRAIELLRYLDMADRAANYPAMLSGASSSRMSQPPRWTVREVGR
jgi:putative ABC transport system ATP-binding protein